MRKRIGVVLTGLALSLPLLTAVGSRLVLRGDTDAVAIPATVVRPLPKAGTVEPSIGTPCRRSAAGRDDEPVAKSSPGANSGCNLRLEQAPAGRPDGLAVMPMRYTA